MTQGTANRSDWTLEEFPPRSGAGPDAPRRPSGGSDLSDSLPLMSRMTATQAARSFSDVLNRVAAGDEVEVTRSGAPVAVIAPPKARLVSAQRFRELMATAPRPDEHFANDVRAARDSAGPPGEPWPS